MKKTIFALMSIVGLFLFLASGCKKDPVIVNDPVVIHISFSDTTPIYDGTSKAFWSVDGQYEMISVSVNGKEISVNSTGSYELTNIIKPQTFSVAYKKVNGEWITEKKVITPRILIPLPTITLRANPDVVEYGESSIISVKTNHADYISSLDLQGVSGTFGDFQTPKLISSTIYRFTACGKGGIAVDSITIKVKDPPTEDERLLCLAPWGNEEYGFSHLFEGPWDNDIPDPCWKDDSMIFNLNSQQVKYDQGEILCQGETRVSLSVEWSLRGNLLFTGGMKHSIVTLSKDSLVWIYESHEILPDTIMKIFVRETYIHRQ